MKRLLTLTVALFVAAAAFAQTPSLELEAGTTTLRDLTPSQLNSLHEHQEALRNQSTGTRAGEKAYWVGFYDALFTAGLDPVLGTFLMWQDTTVRIEDAVNGDFYWQSHAYGDIYDPSSQIINTEYVTSNLDVTFGADKRYRLDSIEFYYLYDRVSPPGIVDTLRVYVFNQSNIVNGTFTDGTTFSSGEYDFLNFKPRLGIVQEFDILLTELDTARAFIGVRQLDLSSLSIGKNAKIGVAFHYLTGQSYSLGDVLFSNDLLGPVGLNNFELITYEEEEGAEPTSQLIDAPAFNMGSFIPGSVLTNTNENGWNGLYITGLAFTAPFRNEHALVYYKTAPIGAHFISAQSTTVDCEVTFNDLSNVENITTWAWSFGDPDASISLDQNPTFIYPENGAYDVELEIRDAGGATFTYERTLVVNNCGTGIDNIDGLQSFDVFPNPASDVLNLSLGLEQPMVLDYGMYDATGSLIRSGRVAAGTQFNTSFDVSGLSAGFYTIKLQNGQQLASKRFMIAE